MGLSFSPLPGQSQFGVVAHGFTPDMIDDPAIRQQLYDLWVDKGMIVFKDLDGLDTQMRRSEIFGESEEHPLLIGRDDFAREDKVSVKINEEAGGIYKVRGEELAGWLAWHKDSIYTDKLNHGGLLWAQVVPEQGGHTGFIDQIAAYDAMPQRLKDKCEGLNVLYIYTRDSWESKFGEHPEARVRLSAFQMTTEKDMKRPRSVHPMVFVQPETGRKVINVSPWFADGIEGMENAEGDALLREVIEHIVAPGREYYHHWTPGEMVLWDNWRMLHCASGTPMGMKRLMRRTTIFGDYALGRKEKVREDA
jgi:taurine dioxygenase